MVKNSDDENEVQWISKEAQIRHEKMLELYQQVQQGIAEGSQPHEELDIFNEVIGAKRYKRQRGSSASSSNGVVNEFRDLIETLNEKIKSQEDQILKYQDEIKEMKDENQKMKDDNALRSRKICLVDSVLCLVDSVLLRLCLITFPFHHRSTINERSR
ncbi:uncharacterized protein LOC113326632 [Papaver somniferum]|uniref:uncharacterized protein LOC113326632 n=1 Tax=Papaver somniferum TaxID=3469 RepID=UPI000E7022CA|nr:uncharacterized protein LOC113326632 [Papaver somniferum]